MKKRFRNPATGETIILEEEDDEKSGDESCGGFRTPFDILDEIDGKDVEKVVIGAALGFGGMLALRGLFSLIARDYPSLVMVIAFAAGRLGVLELGRHPPILQNSENLCGASDKQVTGI